VDVRLQVLAVLDIHIASKASEDKPQRVAFSLCHTVHRAVALFAKLETAHQRCLASWGLVVHCGKEMWKMGFVFVALVMCVLFF
jgi:hypothetical protein